MRMSPRKGDSMAGRKRTNHLNEIGIALDLLKKHLVKIRKAKEAFDPDVRECVREVYGFILRAGLLRNHTVG